MTKAVTTISYKRVLKAGAIHTNISFRVFTGVILSIMSAGLLVLSMPPYGIWILASFGFVPLVLAQYRVLPRSLSSLAMAITIGGLMALYIMDAFLELANAPWFMKWLPIIFGAIILLTDSGTRAFHERTQYRWLVLSSSVGWVGVEMIRSLIPIMGTWGFIAYAYFKQPWLIQPVNIFGIFGLSLINTLFGYALGQYALAWFDKRWQLDSEIQPVEYRKARNWLVGTGLAFLGWIILSLVMLGKPTENKIRVAAIQPDYKSLWTEAEKARNYLTPERFQQVNNQTFERLISQSKEAAILGARLIVWPEGGLTFDPHTKNTSELKKLASDTNAYLVLAYGVEDRNEVTVLSPAGRFLGTYGKNHPVTFVGEKSTTQGAYPTYTTALGELGAIICYDMDFTDTARNIANNGADLVAVPSGDWPGIADKHYAHLVFRAAENRTAMIKVDRSYDSVVIDPYGRIVDKIVSKNGKQATLVADVTTVHTKTIQQFLGDWIGWICLGGLLVFSFLNLYSKNRKNRMGTRA